MYFYSYVYVFLLLCIFGSVFFCHRANWHYLATLTEAFPWFFVSCKANVRV